jgi:hypothetical protein
VTAVTPKAAIAPYDASAAATPRPEARPTTKPDASVRRIVRIEIGPTAAAIPNPITNPRRKSSGCMRCAPLRAER